MSVAGENTEQGRIFDPYGELSNFSERARHALLLAQEEARQFKHNYLGTEHILLGLARVREGVGARVLHTFGADLPRVRGAVEYIIGRGESVSEGPFKPTARAKTVIELSMMEARLLNHHSVGTEHLLIGLLREGEGVAARVLVDLGVTLGQVRDRVISMAASGTPAAAATATKGNVVTCLVTDRDLEAIDALVEAGIRSTRSDAASWLIRAGIDAHQALFDKVYTTVAEIQIGRAHV